MNTYLNNLKKYSKVHINKQKGMTLVELIVVLSIFMLVSGLTIFDYGQFRSNVSLQNLADDIALSIRRTQNYAISAKSTFGSFSEGYGIHFSTAPSNPSSVRAGSQKSFVIFNNSVAGPFYEHNPSTTTDCSIPNNGTADQCIDVLTVSSDDYISRVSSSNGASYPNANNEDGFVTIIFYRPNHDANICIVNAIDLTSTCNSPDAIIEITNRRTLATKKIKITSVGQITIK